MIIVALVSGIGYGTYQGLDSVGLVPHREDSIITAQANWFLGESKDCLSYPVDADTARTIKKIKDTPSHKSGVTMARNTA